MVEQQRSLFGAVFGGPKGSIGRKSFCFFPVLRLPLEELHLMKCKCFLLGYKLEPV